MQELFSKALNSKTLINQISHLFLVFIIDKLEVQTPCKQMPEQCTLSPGEELP